MIPNRVALIDAELNISNHHKIGFLASRSAANMLTLNILIGLPAQLGLEKDSTIP